LRETAAVVVAAAFDADISFSVAAGRRCRSEAAFDARNLPARPPTAPSNEIATTQPALSLEPMRETGRVALIQKQGVFCRPSGTCLTDDGAGLRATKA
jgi:hypothetical protein